MRDDMGKKEGREKRKGDMQVAKTYLKKDEKDNIRSRVNEGNKEEYKKKLSMINVESAGFEESFNNYDNLNNSEIEPIKSESNRYKKKINIEDDSYSQDKDFEEYSVEQLVPSI
uniref:Uncharacterized protein n=1 Tax=Euplotes harpa TaxID=151035 RepID=A0A7S3J7I3_9SPIT|mmetsp:Transcript_24277/g.27967  ORF Transcript_24277/g.27967 Transcript_24277/m.27967 type:complete len:114 (+) Transcript_24277:375-716(+)